MLGGDIESNPGPIATPSTSTHTINIASANIRSLRNKVTETHLQTESVEKRGKSQTGMLVQDTERLVSDLTPDGFGLLHCARKARTIRGRRVERGGGVGCLYDKKIN